MAEKNLKQRELNRRTPEKRTLNVEGQDMIFEIDSGASASVISEEAYDERFSHIKLSVSDKFSHFRPEY